MFGRKKKEAPKPTVSDTVLRIIEINRTRREDQMMRRQLKLGEEVGEANEALLSFTSECNAKGKTKEDYRDELADAMVMIVDLFAQDFGNEQRTDDEIVQDLMNRCGKGLDKWEQQKANGGTITEN